MKNILLNILMLGVMGAAVAAPVTPERARKVAQFAVMQHGVKASVEFTDVSAAAQVKDMYVFDYEGGGAQGFVIVSGEDMASPVLAFSHEGKFDADNMSPATRYMLNGYAKQIAMAKADQTQASPAVAYQWNVMDGTCARPKSQGDVYHDRIMLPLVNNMWNQTYPYNVKCPANVPVGCVALAFSQIMSYWKYPEHGFGRHSYDGSLNPACFPDWTYGVVSADFEHTYYDWEHMPNAIASVSDPADIEAISTLIFQVGVALDMRYHEGGSGSFTLEEYATFDTSLHVDPQVAGENRIPKHFGYKYRYAGLRDSVPDSAWLPMIYQSLADSMPVFYAGWEADVTDPSGHSGSNGHAFIFDGYFSDEVDSNLFHVNWGWGGSNNGYFKLDALDPDNGRYHFDLWQGAIVGMEPDTSYHGYNYLGIEEAASRRGRLAVEGRNIRVMGAEGQPVKVYDVMGRQVAASRKAGAEQAVRVPRQGIYVVLVGSQASKIFVP